MKWIAGVIAATGLLASVGAQAAAYDPGATFSGSNPNGPFSYGYTTTLGGPLTLFSTYNSNNGYSSWTTPAIDPYMGVYALGTSVTLHPGPAGQYSVIEFTVPVPGVYTLTGSFSSTGITTTDTHVLVAGTDTVDGLIGFGQSTNAFNLQSTLSAGQVVDFVVGNGGNGYSSDTTAFQLAISPVLAQAADVPEPVSWSLLGLAAFGTVLVRGKRKAQLKA